MITNDRTLIWSATENVYNKSITLSEPLTHFEEYEIYASGAENATLGAHVAKVSFNTTEDKVMGCDSWGYSPWTTTYNYVLGANIKISGNSGFVGSSYYMGQGSNTTAYAAGKWVNADAPKMLMPYRIYGLNRLPTYNVRLLQTEGGTINVSPNKGYKNDIATLSNTTANENYKFSSYNITGATLTGDQFQFETSDVQVQGNFEHNKTLTLIDGDHGILSADKDKGFVGDIVTVTGTMDEGWYLTGFNTTGATMTGNKFAFAGEDVTVEGLYTDEGFPVVYEADNGVHLTGDPIAIPGVGLTLTTSYDTYYRTNGYDITGGYIENGMLYATAACTARLKSKLNTFTASGGWEKGSNVTVDNNQNKWVSAVVPVKYATVSYKTSNVPTAWYATSNRWKPSNASAYKITLNPKVNVTGNMPSVGGHANNCNGQAHFVTLLGNTRSNEVSTHYGNGTKPNYVYNKTITNTTTGIEYKISGCIGAVGFYQHAGSYKNGRMQYVASNTTGTWVATGIAP